AAGPPQQDVAAFVASFFAFLFLAWPRLFDRLLFRLRVRWRLWRQRRPGGQTLGGRFLLGGRHLYFVVIIACRGRDDGGRAFRAFDFEPGEVVANPQFAAARGTAKEQGHAGTSKHVSVAARIVRNAVGALPSWESSETTPCRGARAPLGEMRLPR